MTARLHNAVKECLVSDKPCFIMAIRHARTIDIVAIAQTSGHHGVYIDLQHSTITEDLAAQMCFAALALGITPLVRLPGLAQPVAEHMLEAGALGIIVPDVRSMQQAREVASWVSFPPAGSRSPLNPGPHTRYAAPRQDEDRANIVRETLTIVMLESEEAIARVDEIAGVRGIDALVIGTNDLTSSMGVFGTYEDPSVQALSSTAIAAAKRHRKPLIVGGLRDPKVAARYVSMGVARCFITGTDTALLTAGAAAQVERFRTIGG